MCRLAQAARSLAPLLLPDVCPPIRFHHTADEPEWWDGDPVDGLCWDDPDGCHIWVSTELNDERTLAVLLHELIHASLGPEHLHDWAFEEIWQRVGFLGPCNDTTPGNDLAEVLRSLAPGLADGNVCD